MTVTTLYWLPLLLLLLLRFFLPPLFCMTTYLCQRKGL